MSAITHQCEDSCGMVNLAVFANWNVDLHLRGYDHTIIMAKRKEREMENQNSYKGKIELWSSLVLLLLLRWRKKYSFSVNGKNGTSSHVYILCLHWDLAFEAWWFLSFFCLGFGFFFLFACLFCFVWGFCICIYLVSSRQWNYTPRSKARERTTFIFWRDMPCKGKETYFFSFI